MLPHANGLEEAPWGESQRQGGWLSYGTGTRALTVTALRPYCPFALSSPCVPPSGLIGSWPRRLALVASLLSSPQQLTAPLPLLLSPAPSSRSAVVCPVRSSRELLTVSSSVVLPRHLSPDRGASSWDERGSPSLAFVATQWLCVPLPSFAFPPRSTVLRESPLSCGLRRVQIPLLWASDLPRERASLLFAYGDLWRVCLRGRGRAFWLVQGVLVTRSVGLGAQVRCRL